MSTDNVEPLTNHHFADKAVPSADRRLLELERERLRLASEYDQILREVVDGDGTGYALIRVSTQLKKVTDEIQRIRHGE